MLPVHRLILAVWMVLFCGSVRAFSADLRRVDSPHYTIWTDLPDDAAREAALRMTKMAEEYARRTADFQAAPPPKMPFYLYAHDTDFFALGATADIAGYFDGRNLVARAEHIDERTWHTVQHEGFHQFAAATIHASLPVWLNEGLAEYFGEALFTGDAFVSGVIPQWRLKRVRQTFAANGFQPAATILSMPLSEWNGKLSLTNYDQAWSMIQFLAHGDGGKYQPALAALIRNLGRGNDEAVAWERAFGNVDDFQSRWKAYWVGLSDDPTIDRYAQAEVLTLVGLLGRSALCRQHFDSFDGFSAAVVAGKINTPIDDWLPTSLQSLAAARLAALQKASCLFDFRGSTIRCHLPNGGTITGVYAVRNGHVTASVETSLKP